MATDYPRDHVNDVDVHIARTTFQNRNFLAPVNGQREIVMYDAVLKLLQNKQVVTGLMTTPTDLEVTCIDTNGERAEYTQQCHGLLARHRNKCIGRDDHFWTRGGPDQCVFCDDPEKALQEERIRRWQESNLTAKEFAAELGINARTLTYWKWKLGRGSKAKAAKLSRSGPTSMARKPWRSGLSAEE